MTKKLVLMVGFYHHGILTLYIATVVLDSSVDMRGVCPGEIVTYTCTVIQGVFLDWIVEPFLPATERIQFTSTTATESSLNCNNVAAVSCSVFDFVATLINTTNSNTVMSTTLADMTSTLTFTATVRLNGTVIQCRGTTAVGLPITNNTLNVAGASILQHLFHIQAIIYCQLYRSQYIFATVSILKEESFYYNEEITLGATQ